MKMDDIQVHNFSQSELAIFTIASNKMRVPTSRKYILRVDRQPKLSLQPVLHHETTLTLTPHLPCLVMIISVWWRWNLSQRGRLQR